MYSSQHHSTWYQRYLLRHFGISSQHYLQYAIGSDHSMARQFSELQSQQFSNWANFHDKSHWRSLPRLITDHVKLLDISKQWCYSCSWPRHSNTEHTYQRYLSSNPFFPLANYWLEVKPKGRRFRFRYCKPRKMFHRSGCRGQNSFTSVGINPSSFDTSAKFAFNIGRWIISRSRSLQIWLIHGGKVSESVSACDSQFHFCFL